MSIPENFVRYYNLSVVTGIIGLRRDFGNLRSRKKSMEYPLKKRYSTTSPQEMATASNVEEDK
jgi:hypothetical protein